MSDPSTRPSVLVILTDQQRFPTPYEPEELRQWRHDEFRAERGLHKTGVRFTEHYTMAAACAPSRASLLTGHYPSLHGVTKTDGLAKTVDSDDMFWLSPDTVPTMGDWFRAGGYRTFFKGKWHASHVALPDPSGDGYLLSIDDEGKVNEENVAANLEADLLDQFGDTRLHRRKTRTVTEPEPDEYELYDLTTDPLEQRNLAHPTYATDASRRLQHEMLKLLVDQLAAKRLVPATGEVP